MNDLSDFQRKACAALEHSLAAYAADASFSEGRDADGRPLLSAKFLFADTEHEIEVFVDSVVMTAGKQLFEPFMPREFTDDEVQINSFAERLNRYLGGGTWEGADR